MKEKPIWISGPEEILVHAKSLLRKDSDGNRRIAFLLIDNSIELMLKTFLSLPERISGIKIKRKEIDDISMYFPKLIEFFEKSGPERTKSINWGEVEWLHRVRNEIYHQGHGLTVEKENVHKYSILADEILMKLFFVSYIVKPGDTLAKISKNEFNSTIHWRKIAIANRINTPEDLKVGMTLFIPKPK